MYPNPLKEKLRNGQTVLGTALSAPTSGVAASACKADIDFLWIDTEHAPYATESLDMIPVIARQNGVAPMIRVAWNDPALIKKAYDVGAVAVMVPQVSNAEEAARAVEYAFYPPKGARGVSPSWPNLAGVDWNHAIRTANDETVLIVQIESREAYDNIEEIAAVPGIDVLFVGPMDMSASLGVITQMQDPGLQEIMREFPKILAEKGIPAGTTLMDVNEIKQKLAWGYRFMNVGNPLA
ncbi:MAG: aldolase/citrate lyase family protein, partial [Caldilineaceae bacterium]